MVRKGGGEKAGGLWNPESNMVGGKSQQKQMTLGESNQVDLVGRDLAHEKGSIWVPLNFQPQIYERKCDKQIADITTPLLGGGSLL